jgi:hypothetical protein
MGIHSAPRFSKTTGPGPKVANFRIREALEAHIAKRKDALRDVDH